MPAYQRPPTLTLDRENGLTVRVAGFWHVHALSRHGVVAAIEASLKIMQPEWQKGPSTCWDLSGIERLDYIGAQLLWNAWGKKLPPQLVISPAQKQFFNRLAQASALTLPQIRPHPLAKIIELGFAIIGFFEHMLGFTHLVGQLVLDLWRFALRPMRGPWREISANIFHAGFQALGITALVGFLIGVVLSFLSAQQLRTFGADVYLVNILGMSVVRELGPLLAAILVAGRSGSAITAQLGVMRVTEEIDAMLVMGISPGFRLILPKVIALAIAMPLLVVWTDAMALIGGMVSAKLELNLSPIYFLHKLPDSVPLANYFIGLGKGVVFGILIALVSCHFGLRIKPNTESLGHGTTTSVVTAITVVILADAVFAIIFSEVGF